MAVTSNCVNEKKFFQLEPGEETRNIPILIDTYQCIAWWRLWKQSKKNFTVFWVLYTQLYTIQLGNLTSSGEATRWMAKWIKTRNLVLVRAGNEPAMTSLKFYDQEKSLPVSFSELPCCPSILPNSVIKIWKITQPPRIDIRPSNYDSDSIFDLQLILLNLH